MEFTCTICQSPAAKPCGRCHSARYCSLECQQTDWPSHSLLCSQYSTHTGRPNPSYKRAILFPPDDNKPQFIWIECRTEVSDETPHATSEYESSRVKDHLGGRIGQYHAFPEREFIQRNVLRDRDLANTLQVVWRGTSGIDGSQLNRSVVRATRDAAVLPWAGPIIALRMNGPGSAPSHYMDIDMQDYRNVVDYFIAHANVSVQDGELGRDRSKLRGVKIHCKGDQRTFGTEVFSAVDVPKDHPIFGDPVAPISQLVGMPIHTRKYPPDKLWTDSLGDPTENVPATWLHLVVDPSHQEGWGWADLPWKIDVGNVLVVRSDGQDVTTRQVEALSRFCQFKMQPLFENALGFGLVEMTKEEVMRYLTPSVFEEFMDNMEEFMKSVDESKLE